MTTSEYINTNIPGEITLLAAPSLPFIKLLYIINDIGTVPNRYFYIDNTDPDEPFLAYDSEPVDDIYGKFINYPKLKGNFAKMDGIMYVTKKGTTLTCATGLFRENGTANIYNNNRIIE